MCQQFNLALLFLAHSVYESYSDLDIKQSKIFWLTEKCISSTVNYGGNIFQCLQEIFSKIFILKPAILVNT